MPVPEGDTVYRAARNLDAALHGAVLTSCDVRVPKFATVDLTGEAYIANRMLCWAIAG